MKTFAIVDGYSTGQALTRELLARGYVCVDVQSESPVPAVYCASYDPTLFEGKVLHEGDITLTAKKVSAFQPDFIIAGSEKGVELADALSDRLGLLTNGEAGSAARRDKYRMGETLRQQGIPCVAQYTHSRLSMIENWVRQYGKFPVVIKPVKSCGADSVTICQDEAQVREACLRILGQSNALGQINEAVLAQEFLAGTEYIVNSVSRDGGHFICDIWECRKERVSGAGYISCLEELLLPNGEAQQQLSAYALSVLDALGLRNGPAHMEIMLTPRGPILIEVGARLQGAIHPPSIRRATGTNQLELTLECYLEPHRFAARVGQLYQVRERLYHIFLISTAQGTLRAQPGITLVKTLPSFFHHIPRVLISGVLERTVNLFTSPGVVDLVHADAAQLERDYQQLRAWEKGVFYEV